MSGLGFNYLTVFPSVAQGAGAAVSTQAVHTYSFIQARMRVAFIDLMEAEWASEAHRAQAREGVNPVDTRATIETGAKEQTGRAPSAGWSGPLTCYLKSKVPGT